MSRASGVKVAREKRVKEQQTEPTVHEIRLRAYEIFVARAGAPGDDVRDWLQAEGELVLKDR